MFWSVTHQKLALAHRGAGHLDQALGCIDVALTSGVDDTPMQRVRLDTAYAHILLTDRVTRREGLALLERSGELALQYGLAHQHRAIAAIRRGSDAVDALAPSRIT